MGPKEMGLGLSNDKGLNREGALGSWVLFLTRQWELMSIEWP